MARDAGHKHVTCTGAWRTGDTLQLSSATGRGPVTATSAEAGADTARRQITGARGELVPFAVSGRLSCRQHWARRRRTT